MKISKKNNIYLDIVRILLCISVFLYHLDILKGGYLAVCSFFTLSGYLSCLSLMKKDNIDLKEYYKKRIKNIYIPLVVVTFLSVLLISNIKTINWINLKPETSSVFLNYNNFWQLNANLDYFTRSVDSPFTHFWYISILIQFDLIFPLIVALSKKMFKNKNKLFPTIILVVSILCSAGYFLKLCLTGNITIAYYNTFARIYSLLIGVLIAYLSYNKKSKLNKKYLTFAMILCLIILTVLFIFIDSSSKYFSYSMIISSIVTSFLLFFASVINPKKDCKLIKHFSNISYEIYLVQYPVIFVISEVWTRNLTSTLAIILITYIISEIIYISLNNKSEKKFISFILKLLKCIVLLLTLGGIFFFIKSEDHTKEMKALEEELNKNELIMLQKQEEYEKKLKEEAEKLNQLLEQMTISEEDLKQMITNMPIVGVGDSVMLGALNALYKTFPNAYLDAKISRTAWVANDILVDLKNQNKLGNPIIFNLGANGDCNTSCKERILKTCEGKEIFWLTVTNNKSVGVNGPLSEFAKKHPNIHVIDWENISKNHPEYFIADGIHLTNDGAEFYAETIFNSIYDYYKNYYETQKENIINEHNQKEKNKVTFIGNDILTGISNSLIEGYPEANFVKSKINNSNDLQNVLKELLEKNAMTNEIVILLDKNFQEQDTIYSNLETEYSQTKFYIFKFNEVENKENIEFIDLNNILGSDNHFISDKIHLSQEGNLLLIGTINETLNS